MRTASSHNHNMRRRPRATASIPYSLQWVLFLSFFTTSHSFTYVFKPMTIENIQKLSMVKKYSPEDDSTTVVKPKTAVSMTLHHPHHQNYSFKNSVLRWKHSKIGGASSLSMTIKPTLGKESAILGFDVQTSVNTPNFSRFGRVYADDIRSYTDYSYKNWNNSTDPPRYWLQSFPKRAYRNHALSPIKKANTSNGSRMKQEHVRKNTDMEETVQSFSKDTGLDRSKTSSSPLWLPFIPTNTQIQELKLIELKSACLDRGLPTVGKKVDLQARLAAWSQEEQIHRVFERNNAFETYLSSSPLSDMSMDKKQEILSPEDTRVLNESTQKSRSFDSPIDSIEPLVNRRKSLLLARDQSRLCKNHTAMRHSLLDSTESIVGENSTRQKIKRAKSFYFLNSNGPSSEQLSNSSLTPTKEYLLSLTRSFYESDADPTNKKAITNNYQIQQLYLRAKHADQSGDLETAKRLLEQLCAVAPYDLRVVRRLARLESQKGNFQEARSILKGALKKFPNQCHLLQGLGALEVKCRNLDSARKYFKEAIRSLPTFPNSYHALATLEHSCGNIRSATSVLRLGLKNCPSNHRLHHAMGDLYREAMMLELAENSYRKGLDCIASNAHAYGKDLNWAKSFIYLSLSYIAFEKGDKEDCRRWLSKSFAYDVNELFSQGWIALASFETSQGRIQHARSIYLEAANKFERKRKSKALRLIPYQDTSIDTESLYPIRMSDRWTHLYSSWARFEEVHGSYDEVNNVYSRAMATFPHDVSILLSWATFQAKRRRLDRARTLFEIACDKASCNNADPYRLYAEFEMRVGNYKRARSIFYLGAQSLSEARDGAISISQSFARLFLSWAVCEWHLDNYDRTEILFDHALRLADKSDEGLELHSYLLFTIARFLYHARKDYPLAQHCICLCLNDNQLIRHNIDVWKHWSKIARAMNNDSLSDACLNQVLTLENENIKLNDLPRLNAENMRQLLRRAPWEKQAALVKAETGWYDGILFPDKINS